MVRLVATVTKITLASLVAGAVLGMLDIRAADLLAVAGLTPADLIRATRNAVDWAIPNILLGLFVTVPVWMLIYVLRPPRG